MKKAIEFIKKNWMMLVIFAAFAVSIPIENAYKAHAEALDWEVTEGKVWRLESGWQYIDEHRTDEKLDTSFACFFPKYIREDNLTTMDIISLIYTGTCHPKSENKVHSVSMRDFVVVEQLFKGD